jgi:hypothetical protein
MDNDIGQDDVRRYAELSRLRKEQDDALEKTKAELAQLEPRLVDYFTKNGITSMKVDKTTVFFHRQTWANAADGDYERANSALKAAGLGHFVKEGFNTQTLSAYYRELEQEGISPPEELKDAIKVTEKVSLRTRSNK